MASGPERPVTILDGDADTAQIAQFERDRRALLRRGIAAGGAVVAASSVPLLLSVRHAFAKQEGDLGILESAITLERLSVLAYETLIDGGLLSARLERIAKHFARHEQAHADGLVAAMTALRGSVPAKPAGVAEIDDVAKGIGDLRSEAGAIAFAIELETAAVGAYYEAHRELVDGKLLQTVASIMASEGQHLVVLRQAAGEPRVPHALERGDQR